jgi:integrase
MGVYLRNHIYWFKKTIEGKDYYRSLQIHKGQEHFLSARLQQVEDEITAEHFGLENPSVKRVLFSDFADRYKKLKAHKKTLDNDMGMLKVVEDFLEDPPLDSIRQTDIERLEQYLLARKVGKKTKRSLTETTVNRYMTLLRHFFTLAKKEGHIRHNPVDGYEFFVEDRTRRALSREELKAVLDAAAEIQADPSGPAQAVVHDLLVLAFNTGMRLGEILNLKREHIQGNLAVIPITSTKYRRRSSSRTQRKNKVVVLNEHAKAVIDRQPVKGEHVFTLKGTDSIKRVVREIRKKSKVQDFTFHQIRHTVSTYLSQTVPISVARTVLGHSSVLVTEKYTHHDEAELRAAVKKIGALYTDL